MEILEQKVPLRRDDDGAIRVGETRVLFELVVRQYRQGRTPEEIIREFPTLTLADAYGAVAYYLQHRDQVETYLRKRRQEAHQLRNTLEEEGVAIDVQTLLARNQPERDDSAVDG
ncbi:MAG: hypothetical protein BRD55_08675 [Bacteroidetes bacterium SW_9_63_38]|nr:MAG: hypothetical protein BRD55_08675 [Bacteroidetes bacterium SW_9_63_38]